MLKILILLSLITCVQSCEQYLNQTVNHDAIDQIVTRYVRYPSTWNVMEDQPILEITITNLTDLRTVKSHVKRNPTFKKLNISITGILDICDSLRRVGPEILLLKADCFQINKLGFALVRINIQRAKRSCRSITLSLDDYESAKGNRIIIITPDPKESEQGSKMFVMLIIIYGFVGIIRKLRYCDDH